MEKAQVFNCEAQIHRMVVRQHACIRDFANSVLMLRIENSENWKNFCTVFAPHDAVSDGTNVYQNQINSNSNALLPFPHYGFILNVHNMEDCVFVGGYRQNDTDITFQAVAAPHADFNAQTKNPIPHALTPKSHQLLAFMISITNLADLSKNHHFVLNGRHKDRAFNGCHFLSASALSRSTPRLQAVKS